MSDEPRIVVDGEIVETFESALSKINKRLAEILKDLPKPAVYVDSHLAMGRAVFGGQFTRMIEDARRVEESIGTVYLLYGLPGNYSYQQIQDACNVLVSHYPEPALATLAMLKGGYPHYAKDFMNILDTLANPAKAEIVKDKPE